MFGTKALNIVGVGDKAQLSVPLIPAGTGPYTISAWIYLTDAASLRTIASNYSPSTNTNGIQFFIQNASRQLAVKQGGVTLLSTGTVPLNTWTHVAVAKANGVAAGNARLYINGVQDATTGTFNVAATTTANFAVGNIPDAFGWGFQGKIDEVKVYLRDIGSNDLAMPSLVLPFDENNGTTAYDFSGRNLNGTLMNGAAWTTGKLHKAVSFDGVDDKVTIPSMTVLTAGTGPFTIRAWIYPFVTTSPDYIVGNTGTANPNGLEFYKEAAATNRLAIKVGGQVVTGTASLPLNTWTHVAVTKANGVTANNTNIYINGLLDTTGTLNIAGGISALSNWTVGSGPDLDTDAFFGKIDDVRIDARAFTAAEIRMTVANEVCDQPDLLRHRKCHLYRRLSGLQRSGLQILRRRGGIQRRDLRHQHGELQHPYPHPRLLQHRYGLLSQCRNAGQLHRVRHRRVQMVRRYADNQRRGL
jgi:hypothetical protein